MAAGDLLPILQEIVEPALERDARALYAALSDLIRVYQSLAAIAIVLGCSTQARRDLFRLAGLVDPALIVAWSRLPEEARAAARAALAFSASATPSARAGGAGENKKGEIILT